MVKNYGNQDVVPQLGESVVEATVSRWLKNEGDFVSPREVRLSWNRQGEPEVGAEHAGVLSRIAKQAGQDVKWETKLGMIDDKSRWQDTGGGKTRSRLPKRLSLLPRIE